MATCIRHLMCSHNMPLVSSKCWLIRKAGELILGLNGTLVDTNSVATGSKDTDDDGPVDKTID